MVPARRYWFPAKRFGWGWGPPSTWQGWVVLTAYTVILIAGFLRLRSDPVSFLAFGTLITALLVVICYLTGEPPKWRWGK